SWIHPVLTCLPVVRHVRLISIRMVWRQTSSVWLREGYRRICLPHTVTAWPGCRPPRREVRFCASEVLDRADHFDYSCRSIVSDDVGRHDLILRSRSTADRPPEPGAAMRSSAQGTTVRLWLRGFVSLLMLVCAPSPSIRAGCATHYVTLRTQATVE